MRISRHSHSLSSCERAIVDDTSKSDAVGCVEAYGRESRPFSRLIDHILKFSIQIRLPSHTSDNSPAYDDQAHSPLC